MKAGSRKGGRVSAKAIAVGTEALRRYHANRAQYPKCGAKNRTTGEPCGNSPMANGRCYLHGGRTPKGRDLHLPVWPNGKRSDAIEKADRKLKDRERAKKRRGARLAAMSPEERARHDAWQSAHRPGVNRAALREERRQNREARELMLGPRRRPVADSLADLTPAELGDDRQPGPAEPIPAAARPPHTQIDIGEDFRMKGTKETIREMREELRFEAARDAIDALRSVCQDPKASSQAKATAASTILRAAGFLAPVEDPDNEKPLHELTADELAQRAERGRLLVERLERERAEHLERTRAERSQSPGLFD